jgi:hypothetical protein
VKKLTVNHFRGQQISHSYEETWERTELRCPSCGAARVWHDTGSGDFYVGETHLCLSCGSHFTIQGPYGPTDDARDPNVQRRAALAEYSQGAEK